MGHKRLIKNVKIKNSGPLVFRDRLKIFYQFLSNKFALKFNRIRPTRAIFFL